MSSSNFTYPLIYIILIFLALYTARLSLTKPPPPQEENDQSVRYLSKNHHHHSSSHTFDKQMFAWQAEKDPNYKPTKTLGSCSTPGNFKGKKLKKKIDKKELKKYLSRVTNNGSYDSVENYIMFFASGRTGHTWIGAIMDAAPNTIVANQLDALHFYERGSSRDSIYKRLATNSYLCGITRWAQVYDYSIKNMWQGKIDKHEELNVIGDKDGGKALHRVRDMMKDGLGTQEDVDNFDFVFGDYDAMPGLKKSVLDWFQGFFDVIQNTPLFIGMLRHPANVIGTVVFRTPDRSFDWALESVLSRFRILLWLQENLANKNQWYLIESEKFAKNTEEELQKICDFAGISCPKQLIEQVNKQTHHEIHETWKSVDWTQAHMAQVNTFVEKYMSKYYDPIDVSK